MCVEGKYFDSDLILLLRFVNINTVNIFQFQ